ncbi:Dabb family protein [Methanimicrococcus blatticola]|uniref:Stress responsive alpha/beta barrel protein n=1 Tax=Methanimicrococcus blatticola TaxID=91560 RepID=A0A484F5B4_9EURY|nr:Dabb family protein [Methanimicrococcus blatticola]MBZ3935958.1 Dabb family protein [Methanimicrococcus blatticola]MCC2509429.1 Dabb family protein [Methanimicrococcus blatticola]TDQ68311.1 stress responsive alpha/beta barrel protein [Methanimicrococcus blatticola]
MIKHIVLWILKPEAEGKSAAENAVIIKERLEGLYSQIPEIKSIEVHSNTLDIAGNYNLSLIAEFESENALYAYQKNPLHEDVAIYVKKVVESRASIDFEF